MAGLGSVWQAVGRGWVAAAVICLVVLGGCGATVGGRDVPAMPGIVPRTLKLGLSAPFEGLYRSIGYEALYGVRLAVQERNAAGGVGGYQVELVALNDFSEPVEALAQARKLAIDPLVYGAIGGLTPEAALSALPVYGAASLAFLSPTPSDLLATCGLSETLAAYISTPALAQAGANLVAGEFEAALAGLLQAPGVANAAWAEALREALAARGVEVLSTEGWAPTLLDADALFVAGSVRDGATWIVEARAAGYTGPIVGGPELHSPLLPLLSEGAAGGAIVLSGLAPVPDSEGWRQDFREVSAGSEPGPMGWWAYGAAYRLLDAMEWDIRQAAGPSRPGVLAQLAATPCSHDVVYRYLVNQQGQFELR